MLLQRLLLCNFRCFHGLQEITFATGENRALTIIHGENGSGKTNILNALYWCLTGTFTPRLQNPELLANKAALDDDKTADCYVELQFSHDDQKYKCVRRVTGRTTSALDLYVIGGAAEERRIQNGQQILEAIIPKGLTQWFFFDAEAVGALNLSGSEDFRRSLRKILGFELIDALSDDLDLCHKKLQKNLTTAVNSKEVEAIQKRIDEINHVLPKQIERAAELDNKIEKISAEQGTIEDKLRSLPKSKPLQNQRTQLEQRRKAKQDLKRELRSQYNATLGEVTPAILGLKKSKQLEQKLHIAENTGRLPSPYSSQLVEDILQARFCICGRPVGEHTEEERKINALMSSASTSILNSRIRAVQFLIKSINGVGERYAVSLADVESKIASTDMDLQVINDELRLVEAQIKGLDDSLVQSLESDLARMKSEFRNLAGEHGKVTDRISDNQEELRKLQFQYENKVKQMGHGSIVKSELSKIEKLSKFLGATLKEQEGKALSVLTAELKRVMDAYLTKHFEPKVVAQTYKVTMVDSKGREVGESTGEGQVLKFAFISTIVALAGRKTVTKMNFLAEPTKAPLVLDAPFSVLDPEYQSSVAKNIVAQASQVVLLISSAAWNEGVGQALDPSVGKRYVLISRQQGARGNKPVKKMSVAGKQISLNEYAAERDETLIRELT